MNQLIIACFLGSSFLLSIKAKTQTPAVAISQNAPTYSTQFTIGASRYSNAVTNLLKDYENNAIDRFAEAIADDIIFISLKGEIIKGKAAFIAGSKSRREESSSVQFTIRSYCSLHNKDKNENEVIVEGTREDMLKDGTRRSMDFIQTFVFNKGGKIAYTRIYASPTIKPQ